MSLEMEITEMISLDIAMVRFTGPKKLMSRALDITGREMEDPPNVVEFPMGIMECLKLRPYITAINRSDDW